MSKNLDQVRSFLGAHGILDGANADELCMVVVPSRRLKSGRIALLFQMNGISCRALGHGTGRVRDQHGVESTVRGLLVLAVSQAHAKRLELYAKLYGVTAIPVGKSTGLAK